MSHNIGVRKIRRRHRPVDNALLDAAELVFGQKGYQQTTMEMLAREADMSVGSIYNLFDSKEDVYGRVAQRIGEFVVRRLEPLTHASDPEEAVLDLIRLRLCNYRNDRLFFQPFCFPSYLGVQPVPERLGAEVNRLHQKYIDIVERIFARCFAKLGQKDTPGIKMSVCLEGMLTAFTSYWSDPLQSDNLAKVARHMRTVLLRGIVPPTGQADGDTAASITESRAIYISRYDLERLQELLEVVRAFGSNENREHADILEEELKRARITNPREVPPDVVTMNSKVRVTSPKTGTDHVYTLVFPRKADLAPENVSILDSFGTALLGRRLRDVFTVGSGRDALMFEVTQILYQPEAAGDFHL